MQKYRADKAGDVQANGGQPFYSDWMGGPSLALIRNCPIENRDYGARTVYIAGEPDTWFSQPAECSVAGCKVRGYVTGDDEGNLVFRQTYY